jgi:murein DD-endopeptidase MepM/ murein hydrolase activator NlpD
VAFTVPLVAIAAVALVAAGRGNHGNVSVVASAAGEHTKVEVALTPVVQSVPSPPRWYQGDDGRFHLQYELMLTNTVPLAIDVTEVEVLGDGRRVEALSGGALPAAMSPLGSETGSTTKLPASSVGIVWLDLSFESRRQLPRQVSHRLTVDVGPGLPFGPALVDTGATAQVPQQQAVVIGPPLRGGRWVALGGPAGPHRRALQAVNGHLRLSQRFAVDFSALLDDQGRSHSGDPDQNASYFNYGQPVLAVAAGTVVDATDGLPDQIPNQNASIPPAEWGGNEVILELDSGIYVGYGHLKPGSVRVEPGQRVRPGEVLGELGNSGNSSGPHLHMQLMTDPSFLDADGLPFVIDGFRLDGVVPSLEAFLQADTAGTPVPIDAALAGDRHRQGITSIDVVTFPNR